MSEYVDFTLGVLPFNVTASLPGGGTYKADLQRIVGVASDELNVGSALEAARQDPAFDTVDYGLPREKAVALAYFINKTVVRPGGYFRPQDVTQYTMGWAKNTPVQATSGPVNPGNLEPGLPYVFADFGGGLTQIDTAVEDVARGLIIPPALYFSVRGQILGGPSRSEAIGAVGDTLVCGKAADLLVISGAGCICLSGAVERSA